MEKKNLREELEALFSADEQCKFPKAFAKKIDMAVRSIIADTLKAGNSLDITGVMTIVPVRVAAKDGTCAGKAYSVPERVLPKAKFSSVLKKSL